MVQPLTAVLASNCIVARRRWLLRLNRYSAFVGDTRTSGCSRFRKEGHFETSAGGCLQPREITSTFCLRGRSHRNSSPSGDTATSTAAPCRSNNKSRCPSGIDQHNRVPAQGNDVSGPIQLRGVPQSAHNRGSRHLAHGHCRLAADILHEREPVRRTRETRIILRHIPAGHHGHVAARQVPSPHPPLSGTLRH